MKNIKIEKRNRLKKKIRSKIFGTSEKPRLSVFRSNKFIYAQLIDDEKGMTLASASDVKINKGKKAKLFLIEADIDIRVELNYWPTPQGKPD